MLFDVFLCYASKDRETVARLARTFREAGLEVWWDQEQIRPQDVVIDKIQQGLAASRFLLACFSDSQLDSGWAQAEVEAALHAELTDGTERVLCAEVGALTDARLPPLLRPRRREDARTEGGQRRLIEAITGALLITPLPSPATELVLTLGEADEGRLEARWPGRSAVVFDNPLLPGEQNDHRWYLEEYLRLPGPGDHARARRFKERMGEWGERLYRALCPHEGAHPLAGLCKRDGPRILTLVSDSPTVLALPWELMHDGTAPLVLRGVNLRRRFPHTEEPAAPAVGLPLRILLVVARPTDVSFIDPRSSTEPMLDALDRLKGLVKVDFCDPPTIAELRRRLAQARGLKQPYHLVHFDGHGIYLPTSGVGALCFEDDHARNHAVPGKELGDLLTIEQIPVALLEACQTADVSTQVFGSVAPALLRAGVGSVIAFSHSVLVSAARILVGHFYQALCDGQSAGAALNDGRAALYADPARHKTAKDEVFTLSDWHIAQLYQAGADPVLVPGGAPARGGGRAHGPGTEPEKAFGSSPLYGFQGRARDMLALRRALCRFGAAVVHGMGGMGKTSLAREAALWWWRTNRRPDGAAFFSFEGRAGPLRACRAFVAYLDGQDAVPGSDDEVWHRAVALFREKEVLWVWDNFESTLPQYSKDEAIAYAEEDRRDLVRLFKELTDRGHKPQGWLLVTCRPEDTGLPAIRKLDLEGLPPPDALALAREVVERAGVVIGSEGYERDAIELLVATLDGHPLSIELVLPHLEALTPAVISAEFHQLLDSFVNLEAEEARNRGLRASLAFSTRRLSPAARAVLPYLAYFDGGAFEPSIVRLAGLAPAAWSAVRRELESTALVRVEEEGEGEGEGQVAGRPFVRFHPTLGMASEIEEVEDPEAVTARFVEIYLDLMRAVDKMFRGRKPAMGMALMTREEGNFRLAVRRAFDRGDGREAYLMADTVGSYLTSAGRTRDQARWAAWVRERLGAVAPEGEALSEEALGAELDHAWGLFVEGHAQQAVDMLQTQLDRLEGREGMARQQALCQSYLGRVLHHAGRPDRALAPLEAAITGFQTIGEDGNLAAVLGDQANALRRLGRLDEALAAAERGLEIDRGRADARSEAAGLGRIAAILSQQQRHAEAEERYEQALAAARRAGDPGLEAALLQHQGSLADDRGAYDRAVARYREALDRFEQTENLGGEMRTCDLLGTAEKNREHYEAARAWYARAHELATRLGDQHHLAVVAQNLGVLFQRQALALPEDQQETRAALLRQAVASVEESLAIERQMRNEIGAAGALFQLGVLHKHLGDLDAAEHHLLEGLAIGERLRRHDVWKDYANLEKIAQARGDTAAAEAWRRKKEAKMAEVARLRAGPSTPSQLCLPPKIIQAIRAMAQDAYQHRTSGTAPSPQLIEALAKLTTLSDPLPAVAAFLTAVALSQPLPDLPPDLPPDLDKLLQALAKSCT